MRTRPESLWIIAGAVAGGMVVAPFHLEPAWAWGMGAGLAGGTAGAAAAWAASRPWPRAARLPLALLLLAAGLALLWLVAGREYVTDPRNWDVRAP